MKQYDKRYVLDEDIKPLMDEIGRIAKMHSIQYVCTFQLAVIQRGEDIIDDHASNGYTLNDEDFPASLRIRLMEFLSKLPPTHLPEVARRLGMNI